MLATGLSLTAKTLARRSSRRAALAAASAGAALFGARAAAQEATPVTNAGMGSNALEFVGTIQQRGLEFSLLAYVTHIADVDRTVLFGGADPFARSEGTAAITMVGNAMATSRSILQNIFVINAEGTVDFYLGDGGNSFDDPDTFSSGALVANSSVQIQNIINVQAPQQGIAQGVGDLVLNTVESMPLIGSLSSFAPGIRLRLSFTGQGTLHVPETLEATILVAGNGVALA
jgi:hypothetical protein